MEYRVYESLFQTGFKVRSIRYCGERGSFNLYGQRAKVRVNIHACTITASISKIVVWALRAK